MPTKIMALDIGTKTVGIALSDELHLTAQAYKTLRYQNPKERKQLFLDLAKLIREQNVYTIIFGMPYNMNGTPGPQAEKTIAFIDDFKNFFLAKENTPEQFEWIPIDERWSTLGAEKHLISANVSRDKRKAIIDTSAAVFLLQGYLQN